VLTSVIIYDWTTLKVRRVN